MDHPRTAFISLSYKHRNTLNDVVESITHVLSQFDIAEQVFVDNYQFAPDDAAAMMQQSCHDIAQCDFMIAEVSYKAIGIGVEAGYAVGLGKPLIYMRHRDTEHSTTVAGISTYQIIYNNPQDLEQQLRTILDRLMHT